MADAPLREELNKTVPELARGTGANALIGTPSNCEHISEMSFRRAVGMDAFVSNRRWPVVVPLKSLELTSRSSILTGRYCERERE